MSAYVRLALTLGLVTAGCAEAPKPTVVTPTAAHVEPPPPPPPAAQASKAEPSKGAAAPTLARVLDEANAAGTPPLLYFGTVWCGPCDLIEKQILPNMNVTSALASYRFQKYDAEIGEGAVLADKFAVSSYPTLVFLTNKGEEVARMTAPQTPEGFAEALKTKLVLAKTSEATVDPTNAPKILESAKVEEQKSDPGAKERARKLYVQAATLAKKQKLPELAAEADFAILQLDTRTRDRKAHATALLDYARLHSASAKAIDAVEGLIALMPETKLADVKKVGPALVAAHKGVDLRRLAAAFKKLGDEADATRAEDAATKEAAPMLVVDSKVPEAFRFSDPLAVRFSFGAIPGAQKLTPEQQAKAHFPGVAARQLVEDCRDLPRTTETIAVRVYPASGGVSRAVVLDPEAAPELKTCLEKSALGLKSVPADLPERVELRVVFSVKK